MNASSHTSDIAETSKSKQNGRAVLKLFSWQSWSHVQWILCLKCQSEHLQQNTKTKAVIPQVRFVCGPDQHPKAARERAHQGTGGGRTVEKSPSSRGLCSPCQRHALMADLNASFLGRWQRVLAADAQNLYCTALYFGGLSRGSYLG